MRISFRRRSFDDRAFLDACAEVFALRKQVHRLTDQLEADRREFIAERRAWKAKEQTYVDVNHDIAAKLTAADAQLIAWTGQEHR